MPLVLAMSIAAKEVWDSWLSKISKMGLSLEQRVCSTTCSKSCGRIFSFVHSVLDATPVEPFRAKRKKWSLCLTLGK